MSGQHRNLQPRTPHLARMCLAALLLILQCRQELVRKLAEEQAMVELLRLRACVYLPDLSGC